MDFINIYQISIIILLIVLSYGILRYRKSRNQITLKPFEKDLFKLIEKENFENFKSIFEENNADPDLKNLNGDTLFLHSISIMNKSAIQFLEFLRIKGANMNAQDKRGTTPLFRAIYWNANDIFDYLMKQKIELDTINTAFGVKMNPLTACVFKDRYNSAIKLLHKGADPFLADEIIQNKFYSTFDNKKYIKLFDFFKRYQKGKRAFLYCHYWYQKGLKPVKQQFNLLLLPNPIIKTISMEYL